MSCWQLKEKELRNVVCGCVRIITTFSKYVFLNVFLLFQEYDVFRHVQALYILVPSILGLKGNLDMCLASRMSTHVNMGLRSSKREIFLLIVGNIGLVQVIKIAYFIFVYDVLIEKQITGSSDCSCMCSIFIC